MNLIELYVEEAFPEIKLEIEDYVGGGSGGSPPDYYDGEYNIIPKTVKQEIPTRQKTMRDDVTVEEIPVHEFSNDSGTTIVIGGIL